MHEIFWKISPQLFVKLFSVARYIVVTGFGKQSHLTQHTSFGMIREFFLFKKNP